MAQLNLKQPTSTYLPPTHITGGKGLLQRKCSCGNHSSGGQCEECGKKNLQRKLTLGASNDPLELEADRVAEQVVDGAANHNFHSAMPSIQRASASDHQADDTEQGDVPESVEQTLASAGRPLPAPLRRDMEAGFGRDFSQVRLHTGALADRSTDEVNARAYTVGNQVVFGQSHFAPDTRSGRQLLAHELTHVVQQGASGNQVMRAPKKNGKGNTAKNAKPAKPLKPKDDDKPKGEKSKTKPAKPKGPQICERPSRKVKDNFITKVSLDVGTHTLKITWDDPSTAPALSAGSHKISPGTGKCCVDCDDETTSQTNGSLCTPKGGEWPVFATGCELSGHPTAKNPTYFQRAGVAIHSGNLSSPPASHGCARTSLDISELIHDNVIVDKTKIASSGTWAGSRCFMKEPDKRSVDRASACDGNKLKPPPKKAAPKNDKKKGGEKKGNTKKGDKAKGKQAALTDALPPIADALPTQDDNLSEQSLATADDYTPDGPGPNNAGADSGTPVEQMLDEVALEPDPEPDTEGEAA